jgi:hypothetical protein
MQKSAIKNQAPLQRGFLFGIPDDVTRFQPWRSPWRARGLF